VITLPRLAWAEGAGGSYQRIATIYYGLIAVLLIYGVYGMFGKNVVKYVGPLIAIGGYVMVPDV
jgi:hypothetical protein